MIYQYLSLHGCWMMLRTGNCTWYGKPMIWLFGMTYPGIKKPGISPERIRTVVLSSCSSNEVTDENSPGIWGYLIWIPGAKSAIWCRDRGFALRFSCCLHKLWEICLPWSTRCERDFEPWLNGWFVFHVLASAFYDLHEENCIQSPCHVIWA